MGILVLMMRLEGLGVGARVVVPKPVEVTGALVAAVRVAVEKEDFGAVVEETVSVVDDGFSEVEGASLVVDDSDAAIDEDPVWTTELLVLVATLDDSAELTVEDSTSAVLLLL